MFSVYVHIPFCKSKCNYCDFYSGCDLDLIDEFLNSLEREINLQKDIYDKYIYDYRTLYVGGGTPSVLNLKQLEKLLEVLNRIKEFKKLDEITFELNPESVDKEKLKLLKSCGINRISFGLQTTDNRILKWLGRIHIYEEFLRAYSDAKDMGFENINIDLMYSFENQSEKDLLLDLKRTTNLKPEHISAYCLEIHENTTFYNKVKVDDEKSEKFYYIIKNFLEDKGYMHYEISNFAFKGYESKHNLNYWNWGDYIGFGPSACSHIGNLRFKNTADVKTYINALNNDKIELEYRELLDEKDIWNEKVILALRKIEGIELDSDIYLKFKNKIDLLIKEGYIVIENGYVKIKKDYLFVSNEILSRIIE